MASRDSVFASGMWFWGQACHFAIQEETSNNTIMFFGTSLYREERGDIGSKTTCGRGTGDQPLTKDIWSLKMCLPGLGTGEKVRVKVGKGICDSDASLAVRPPHVGSDLSGLLGFQAFSIIEKRF